MRGFSRKLGLFLFVVLAFAALALRSRAAAPEVLDGFVVGVVMSEHGIPVAGARVVLVDPQTGIVDWMHTDESGAFRFRDLPPAQYGVLAWSTRFGKGLALAYVTEGRPTTVLLPVKMPS
jgi:hypothetical protein